MHKAQAEVVAEIPLGPTIKQLRQDCNLTQVNFAAALGLTPASIYRYEAGTTRPSPETLSRLYRFAVEHKQGPAEHIFRRAMLLIEGGETHPHSVAFTVMEAHANSLSDEQLILAIALMRMLTDSSADSLTAYNVLRALLARYITEAERHVMGAAVLSGAPASDFPLPDPLPCDVASSNKAKNKPE